MDQSVKSESIALERLQDILQDPSQVAGSDYLVVDVRSIEEIKQNGSIPGSVHIDSQRFAREDIIDQTRGLLKGAKNLYFHCAQSQVRGPTCAGQYVTAINQSSEQGLAQDVFVLEGGFDLWKTKFGTLASHPVSNV